jgi:S-adenosylmethionine-dependent methyltransferase
LSGVAALVSVLVESDLRGSDTGSAAWPRGRSALLWASLQGVLRDLPGSAVAQVLDCGGGSGSLAVPLAAHGARVTVVDVSIDALSTLLRRATEAGVADRVTAVQGEAESLSELVAAGTFDLVLAHDVLEDVSSPQLALRQIAAALRPGGVASLVMANSVAAVLGRALTGDLAGALATLHRSAQSYDVAAVLSQCLAAGLRMRSVEGLGVFTELVPGIQLERPGALAALWELESAVAAQPPYRDIASRLHILAVRPVAESD